jgi:Flp pilus assembly protein TadD
LLASNGADDEAIPPVEATSPAPVDAATAPSSWESLARTLCATPDDDGALDGLLQIGMAEGRWRELVDVLAPVVARLPDRLETRFALAHACLRIGRVADARGHYERLRAARPSWPLLHDLGAALASASAAAD